MKIYQKALLIGGAVLTTASAFATGGPDLSGVDSQISATSASLVAEVPAIVGYGLALGALIFGSRVLWRTFKSMGRG